MGVVCGFFNHSLFCRRKHNMEELHEVAKEFDLHHLCVGGGGGTGGGTGVRLRVHSQPAMNVSTLHVEYLHFFPPSLSHLSFLLSFLLTFPFSSLLSFFLLLSCSCIHKLLLFSSTQGTGRTNVKEEELQQRTLHLFLARQTTTPSPIPSSTR